MNPHAKLRATDGAHGSVVFDHPSWLEMDPLLRADILKDWIHDLQNEYHHALKELWPDVYGDPVATIVSESQRLELP